MTAPAWRSRRRQGPAPRAPACRGRLGRAVCAWALWLAACSTTPERPVTEGEGGAPRFDLDAIPDAVPRVEPLCKYGNPPVYEVERQRYVVMQSSRGYVERGMASWYGREFHNRYTSCREPYDMFAMTAAHRSLPLPTYVQVTNLLNGRRVVVRVNDRGPFRDNRILDLSYTAAYKLGALGPGTIPVEVRAIDPAMPWQPGALQAAEAAPLVPPNLPTAVPPSLPPILRAGAAATYLQVGAFAAIENAERLRAQLEGNGVEPVFIEPAGALYRVRVGPLVDPDAAGRVQQKLSYLGLGKPHVVP